MHYQHKGPIGQFHVPKEPRFRFDEERREVVSLVPNIEVVSHESGGREIVYKHTLLKVGNKHYELKADFSHIHDENGKQIFQIGNDGRQCAAGIVWDNIRLGYFDSISRIFLLDQKVISQGNTLTLENARIADIDNSIARIVYEYLSVDRHVSWAKETEVVRLIISKHEPIQPKVWEVIRDE